ncbi:MAG TPA: NAD-dependent epimerase/dehydratase family protein [Planctomycetota bacterium]|jgi:UDP-glucose 4-epimerase|nr:NAD-dependent epimerase/dehydratase family protein [Planctomycetota bacterium]
MRTLVTGGAGFIGSHLVEELLRRGEAVSVLDDLSTGREGNLADVRRRIELVRASALDRAAFLAAARGCGRIVHLAAAVGVRRVLDDPLGAVECNVLGTANAVRAALEVGAALLLASSSEVYGVGHSGPLSEDAPLALGSPSRPRTAYGLSKALAESLVGAAGRRGLQTLVVRLFNVVGPRQRARYGMVLPRFADAAIAGAPLEVHGDGGQRRAFAFVRDAVASVADLLAEPCAWGGTFNVGEDRETTILELARLVVERAGTRAPLRFVPHARALGPGVEDFARRVPDLTRLRALLPARTPVPLEAVVDAVLADRARRSLGAARRG